MRLRARRAELDAVSRILQEGREGRSHTVVLRGDAGIGKTALLNEVSAGLEGWHIAKATGVESEMELAFSGLHQLCATTLHQLERLPAPQRDALETAFGLSMGPPPDQFLVALGSLMLFAEAAEQQPLLCIVDDAQWLDQASAQALAFVARRLLAERVVIICAARTGLGDPSLSGLPELAISGLPHDAARELLLENVHGPLDPALCDQIVAESRGNPLALIELPQTWKAPGPANGVVVPEDRSVAGRVEQSYVQRLQALPRETRTLIVTAAAEPTGDPVLLREAASALALDTDALAPAVDAGLLGIGQRVRFAHPLVRSAAYQSASPEQRRVAHRALAAVTDAERDPDRRAWHRARATPVPDEDVAAELERSAGRAQARGGLAAAAAFLTRATELTPDAADRVRRGLDAAAANVEAGAFDTARSLLAIGDFEPLDDAQQVRADLLRARVALASSRGNAAVPLLVAAARRLEAVDPRTARETYLDAFGAAHFGSHFNDEVGLAQVASAARAAPAPSGPPGPADLLLDAYAALEEEDYATAVPICRQALAALRGDTLTAEEQLRWAWYGIVIALEIWDDDSSYALSSRYLQLAREAGALSELARALTSCPSIFILAGDFERAGACVTELESVQDITGVQTASYTAMPLLAWRGAEEEARALVDATISDAAARGEGAATSVAEYSRAVLCNGLGRYEEAAAAAAHAANHREPAVEHWALKELVESAARMRDTDLATDALDRLSRKARAAGTAWALGIEQRCRALLAGSAAETHYRGALDALSRTSIRTELARTHLLYGEWLRAEGRDQEASGQLEVAFEQCASIGMLGFAARAAGQLAAIAPATERRFDPGTHGELTPQEEQIARLASDGLSNPEIAARLFISPRTVEWHLRTMSSKRGVRPPDTGR